MGYHASPSLVISDNTRCLHHCVDTITAFLLTTPSGILKYTVTFYYRQNNLSRGNERKRTKSGREGGVGRESRGLLQRRGDSRLQSAFRAGTGAIRSESFMLSQLSAPQAQCLWHFACPVLQGFGTLRVSHIFADARRTRMPPVPLRFLVVGCGR